MKTNPDVIHRCIAGEHVLIPIGGTLQQTDGMFMLSEVGGRIWELIEAGLDRDAIVDKLCQEYDAPPQVIAGDADDFIRDMLGSGLLEE